jgi:hypothetical protein
MDKRISGRTEQLNLKVSPNFRKKLKLMAAKQDCLLIEVLEQALEFYQKKYKGSKKTKKLSDYVKVIPAKPKKPKPQLKPYFLKGFGCDNCGSEYYDETAYSYAPSMKEINDYRTYCSNCIN